MKRSGKWLPRLMLLCLLGLWSCGGGDDGDSIFEPDPDPQPDPDPIPGFVSVRLASPNGNDGALRFMIAGGQMDSLRTSGLTLFSTGGSTSMTAIVAGTVNDGTVAQFWIPDVANVAQYTASLQEAAARDSYEQQSLSGYTLSVAR